MLMRFLLSQCFRCGWSVPVNGDAGPFRSARKRVEEKVCMTGGKSSHRLVRADGLGRSGKILTVHL